MNRKGFTLVELAVVLVIIGVILGGVIKGQELVQSAKLKQLYRNYQQVEFAFFSYLNRFGSYPGDRQSVANQDNRITTAAATKLDGSSSTENLVVWEALRDSRFLKDGLTGITLPVNEMNGTIEIFYGVAGLTNNNSVCLNNIANEQAQILDTQFDDGIATTGQIRGAVDGTDTYTPSNEYDASTTNTDSICISID